MQNLAAGHGSDDGQARSAAIASHDMDALESSPPTLVVAGGQQQEQAHSAKASFQESISDLPESIANFQGSLPKDGGNPLSSAREIAREIAKAASPAASSVVGAAGAFGVGAAVVGASAPSCWGELGPLGSLAPVAKPSAKPPPEPKAPPPVHPVSVGPPENPGNVVAPRPALPVKRPPFVSTAPPGKQMPVRRPLQQQEGEINLQGSVAPGAQVAEPNAAVVGTLEAEVEAEGVATLAPASVGPARPPDRPPTPQQLAAAQQAGAEQPTATAREDEEEGDWEEEEDDDPNGELHLYGTKDDPRVPPGMTFMAWHLSGMPDHRSAKPPPAMDQADDMPPIFLYEMPVEDKTAPDLETTHAHPGHWPNEQGVGSMADELWEDGEALHARQVPNAQQEAQQPREEGVSDEIGEPGHGYSQHPENTESWQDGWNTESWQEGGNRWSWRREQQDVTADDHGGRHEPQQNQTRFILMINGRKLHRPVLFS